MPSLSLSATPPAADLLPPETWQQVQALLAQWVLPHQSGHTRPATVFARSLPASCEPCLSQVAQLNLPHGYAVWVLPARVLASGDGKALRQFLLQQNWLDIVMPLYREENGTLPACYWLLLLHTNRQTTLTGLIGARPGREPSPWSAALAAQACAAFWERRLHPGYLAQPWDVVLQDLGRFGLQSA